MSSQYQQRPITKPFVLSSVLVLTEKLYKAFIDLVGLFELVESEFTDKILQPKSEFNSWHSQFTNFTKWLNLATKTLLAISRIHYKCETKEAISGLAVVLQSYVMLFLLIIYRLI